MDVSLSRILPAALLLGGSLAGWAAPPGAELLFKTPQYSAARVSPDGQSVAFVAVNNGVRNLAALDLVKGSTVALTDYKKPFEVLDVHWQNNGRLLYSFAQRSPDAVELRILLSVGADGKDQRTVVPGWIPATVDFDAMDSVMSYRRRDPTAVAMNFGNLSGYNGAVELHPQGNPPDRLGSAPGRHCYYLMDHEGVVRVCLSFEEDQSRQLYYRESQSDEWRLLGRFSKQTGLIRPIAFTADNRRLYVISSYERDSAALFEFDPQTDKLGGLLFSVPGVDVTNGLFAGDAHTLIGVSYVDDRRRSHYFDEQIQALYEGLEKNFADDQVSIDNWSDDNSRAIVSISGPAEPGKYFLWDQRTRKLKLLGDSAPWIDRRSLSVKTPVSFRARDHMQINGRLTLPVGAGQKDLALVVRPREISLRGSKGGDWDPVAQFLASLGYAVLDLEIRGSDGLPARYELIGKHELGRNFQNDLADGADWLIDKGVVRKGAVCTMGETYGALGALMAVAESPGKFKCAVSIGGMTRLSSVFDKMIRTSNIYRERTREELGYWTDFLGAADGGSVLAGRSPIDNVDKISAAVFIAQGYDDVIVPYADAVNFKNALERSHKPVEFFESRDEGHGFALQETNIALYTQIGRFLNKYNPPH